jgi:cell wall assembly regulator SMI1
MATWKDVRRIALALPETTEENAQWKVRDRAFVWERPLRKSDLAALGDAAPAGPILGVYVENLSAKTAAIAHASGAVFTTPHFNGFPAVLVALDRIPAVALEPLIAEAWLCRAPKAVAKAFRRSAEPHYLVGLSRRLRTFLEKSGIDVTLAGGPPATPAAIGKVESRIGLSFPPALRELYGAMDGYACFWENAKDGRSGGVQILPLAKWPARFRDWKESVLWMDTYAFPNVSDRKRAKTTYARMKSWLPFITHANGDAFCLAGDTVVHHQHDWYDGGTGDNGRVVAPTLEAFLTVWAGVCFTTPKSGQWPFTTKGVSWTAKHFDRAYML